MSPAVRWRTELLRSRPRGLINVQRLQAVGGNDLIARSLGISWARIVLALKPKRPGLTRHCENLKGESAIGGRTHRHRKFRITVAQLVAPPKCPPPGHLPYCSAVTRCATRKSCEHNGDGPPSGRAWARGAACPFDDALVATSIAEASVPSLSSEPSSTTQSE